MKKDNKLIISLIILLILSIGIGYVLDGNDYYLKGGVDESALSTKPVYEANKSVLISSFGSANCTDHTNYMTCTKSDLSAVASLNGEVAVDSGAWECRVIYSGYSRCYSSSVTPHT